ncbi:PREDICTED: general vesicular transport factor p115-like [Branchiostoma belcheri]|uniref:General vesicular transport factor p115 n=1 Tax=Branchiostoma belcheri TaxID=7741 RepID=A0A6P4ZDL0_BRABE|nr:PREDICTED: general vesicular transport factor p115-like [Branchiostoma belcheri]
MNYLKNFLATQPGTQPTGAETIERLCDRVQSSTLLDDRRDAVRALKALSKKFRLEVGTQGMDILINVLETDRTDGEIVNYALDTMNNIMCNNPEDDDEEDVPQTNGEVRPEPEDLGGQFTEIFIKKLENVQLLLNFLEEYDFRVRWPTVKLMTTLLCNRCSQMQQIILNSPVGVSRLMDLISDAREVIRNDGLLLLIQLTKGNAAIQKIVAFENAFERLLEIIVEEGHSDGGIVVEDCLLLMMNLLKNNNSNQTLFKEGGLIQKLTPFFDITEASPTGGWSAQKVTNLHLMLKLVRTLVSPNNPTVSIAACQKVMNTCGLLEKLCMILMASGVPADILTETINTVSEVIRGNTANQEYFASVNAPSQPPRPAIVVLLMSMVNEKQPFVLRCAVLYCFQCFLFKNEVGQAQIVQTLLPTTADASAISAGQLLCAGLFSTDALSNWCASVALSHALKDNPTQKEQLLRVQLATSIGNPPVSLLQQCTNILSQGKYAPQGGKLQTRLGLLILLCSWLSDCSIAVTHFLHNATNVPFLTSQITDQAEEDEQLAQGLFALLLGICVHYNDNSIENFTKERLQQLIIKRIGLESFEDKLSFVTKSDHYSRAARSPQPRYDAPEKVLLDYEFVALFRQYEGVIMKAVRPKTKEEEQAEQKTIEDHAGIVTQYKELIREQVTHLQAEQKTIEDHAGIVTQYKELIREQDAELHSTKQELQEVKVKLSETEKQLQEQASMVQQLRDQYSLLKATKGQGSEWEWASGFFYQDISCRESPQVQPVEAGGGEEAVARLQGELGESKRLLESKTQQLMEKDKTIEQLKNDLTVAEAKAAVREASEAGDEGSAEDSTRPLQDRIQALTLEKEELRTQLSSQETEIQTFRTDNETLKAKLSAQTNGPSPEAVATETAAVQSKLSAAESQLACAEEENRRLKEQVQQLQVQNTQLQNAPVADGNADSAELEEKVQRLSEEKKRLEEEAETASKEQDDLLVLLADQDAKIKKYRDRLKELGEQVDDDDDDGDLEDDEDYEDEEDEEEEDEDKGDD